MELNPLVVQSVRDFKNIVETGKEERENKSDLSPLLKVKRIIVYLQKYYLKRLNQVPSFFFQVEKEKPERINCSAIYIFFLVERDDNQ